MNPNDPRIVSGYGELLVLTARAEEGTELLIKAYELDPVGLGGSNADKRLGDVMFGAYVKGDYQQCLEYDKKVGQGNYPSPGLRNRQPLRPHAKLRRKRWN